MKSPKTYNLKIFKYFLLIFIAILIYDCDDIFVMDISSEKVIMKAPSDGWEGTDQKVNFRWEKVPEADNYILEVATPRFSDIHTLVFEKQLFSASFDTTFIQGEYEWRVKAVNSSSETEYATSSFKISAPFNIELKNVNLRVPENEYLSKINELNFIWEAVENAGYYLFKIKKLNWSGDSVVGVKLYSTHYNYKLNDGEFCWGVAAVDTVSKKKTDYSIRSFIVDKNPPPIPVIIAPQNHDTINSLTVSFKWHKAELNVKYIIEIYTDTDLKNKIIEQSTADTTIFVAMENMGHYYWRIKSVDQFENSGNFSTLSTFYIHQINDISNINITPVSPINKSTILNNSVNLWWIKIADVEKYNVQLVTPSFSNPQKLILDDYTDANNISLELEEGNYEWRIKGFNNISETAYSEIFSFSVYNTDLTKELITLLTPTYEKLFNNSKVHLSWEKLDSNPRYYLLVKKDSWESGIIVQELNTFNQEIDLNLSDGEYFWGVKATNQQNDSETKFSISKFIVDTSPPGIPLLLSPDNNFFSYDFLLEFNWESALTSDNNDTYTIELFQTSNNSTSLFSVFSTQQKSIKINFENEGKYKWRVYATDNAGNKSGTSEFRNIEIQQRTDLSDYTISLNAPVDKSMSIEKNVTFWWDKINGADKYNFQLVSPSFTYPVKLISDQWITANSVTLEIYPGNYEWRVKASNDFSETSYTQSSFSIYENDFTDKKVTLIKPIYDEFINTSIVNFNWEEINHNADYHLLIKRDSWESGPIVHEVITKLTSKEFPFLSGVYYWGVKAIDPINNSETDYSFRHFTIDLATPEIPLMISPTTYYSTSDSLFQFSWEPADPLDKELTYKLEVYQIIDSDVSQIISKTTKQNFVTYDIEKEGKYKWRINATDRAGNSSDFSEYKYFEIQR